MCTITLSIMTLSIKDFIATYSIKENPLKTFSMDALSITILCLVPMCRL
jgi:hypothetical protein